MLTAGEKGTTILWLSRHQFVCCLSCKTYSIITFCTITNFLLVCYTRFNKHNQLDIVTNANEIKTESGPNEYANTDW